MNHLILPTLVLNKAWQPIAITTVCRAIVMVSNGSAEFLDDDYSRYDLDLWLDLDIPEGKEGIGLCREGLMKIPEIIVLNRYDQFPKREVKLTRHNLMVRDGFICQYTGDMVNSKTATIDHVLPTSRGGKNTWENVVLSSQRANRKKANRTPEEAGMRLNTVPRKPDWNPAYSRFAKISKNSRLPEVWKQFLPKKWNMEIYQDIELQG